MNGRQARSGWVSRNPDYLAVAAILLFGAAGSAMSHAVRNPLLIVRGDQLTDTVRPRVWEIRDQTRQASECFREEIQRQHEEFRDQCLRMREELSQAREESQCWRSEAQQLRDTIRRQVRSVFRRSANLRLE
ncbi:MAG: hypothetical protein IT167_03935 [Bryobacterales bacterium]|nr:hypothetical protein [Bryobacterales bacterium]